VAERAFGIIVGGRQVRIGDEGDHGVPVIEDFAGQPAHLGIDLMAVTLTVPFDTRDQSLDGCGVIPVMHALDQAA